MTRKYIRWITALAVLVSLLLMPGATAFAQDEAPSGISEQPPLPAAEPQTDQPAAASGIATTGATAFFLHVATPANTVAHVTTIDHPAANGNSNALVFVTHNYNPGGIGGVPTYNDHAVGVWYNDGKWKIFNQDLAAMPANAAFNVMVLSGGSNAFIHRALSSNTGGNSTLIENPLTTGRPNALLLVTPNYSAGPVYNPHPINVYYNIAERWAIGNQNGADMPVGMAFNVLVLEASPNAFVHRTTAGNRMDNFTYINNPLTNNRPNRFVFITQNYNPGGGSGTYNARHVGVWYDTTVNRSSIFNENTAAAIPINAAFNVYVPTGNTGAFVHRAVAGNITANQTTISNPLIDGSPHALVFVTANRNPNGAGGTYNNHPIGVYYDYVGGRWRIFNQSQAAMPANAAFNVLAPDPGVNVFLHKATPADITGNVSCMNYPLTNGNPNARLLITPNWNPGGMGGVYNNHPVGVAYISGRWCLTNQDGGAIEPDASFNVMVLPANSHSFVHTAIPGNTVANYTHLDHPRTNGNPTALVFATLNWNPGGGSGTYNNRVTGVWYTGSRWAIFNQDQAAMPPNAAFNVYVVASRTYLPMIVKPVR